MESDDAGLQPQTSVEPGELREIDGSGGGESPAKRLNQGGTPFFPFVGEVIVPGGYPYGPNLWKTKTGDLNFRPPVKLFLRPSLALRWSFHTASRLVRPRIHIRTNQGNSSL